MKQFIKLLTLGALLLSSKASAATIVTACATNSLNSILTTGSYLISVQVANATGVTSTVGLFDTSSTNLTYTRGAFTGSSSYTTNIVTTYTNINAVVTSITNAALYTLDTTVASAVNSYRLVNLISVPANSTVTWTPIDGVYNQLGLTATNNAVVTVTTTYAPIR